MCGVVCAEWVLVRLPKRESPTHGSVNARVSHVVADGGFDVL